MKKNIILPALSISLIIPMTACASQLFKKSKPQQQATEQTASPNNPVVKNVQAANILDGEWIIKNAGGMDINREENYPYINFVTAENSFYASNGCNVLNGVFTVEGTDKITFHNVLTTMRYCPDTPFDAMINSVLSDEKQITFKKVVKDGESYLYFYDAAGKELMKMRKPGLDFLNGNWRVAEIDGEKFNDEAMTIFFDMQECRVHGNTGCNSFNGDIYIDPQNNRGISLSNMAVTMRMCPNIEQQSKFLVALEKTSSAKAASNGDVYLTDSEGKEVIKLVPLTIE